MFKTRDLYGAAFYMAVGCQLNGHSQDKGNTTFTFIENDVLDKAVAAYSSLSASVNPVAYANAIRTLKSIVNSNIYINHESTKLATIRKGNTAIVSR